MTCIDCGAEVHTKSPRCEPCRVERFKGRQQAAREKYRKQKEPAKGKKIIHCNWCFELFTQHQDDQIVCHACRREDGWSKLPPVQRFRHPMNEWLSGKPITKVCQHEY